MSSSSPSPSKSEDESFEGHRLHFLKMLGLSPSTTRVPQTPPPQQVSSTSNTTNAKENENELWTFVGNVSGEEPEITSKTRSFSSPVVVRANAEETRESTTTSIPAVERHVSRSVDFLLQNTAATPSESSSKNIKQPPHRNLLHLSPSRALSKEELGKNVQTSNSKRNTSNNKRSASSLQTKSKQMKNNKLEAISSMTMADNKQLRSLAFKSPARWKHTSNFDIHAFLPADTVVNFDEEESKALEQMMKEDEEKQKKKKKENDTTIRSASTSTNLSSVSASTTANDDEGISITQQQQQELPNQTEVAKSLHDAGQVIQKLLKALKIQRETNSVLSSSKNNSNNNVVPSAEEYLRKFNSRYAYLYQSETKDEEFEKAKMLKDLQHKVMDLEREKTNLIRKHKEELARVHSNLQQQQQFASVTNTRGVTHQNNLLLTPHYAMPTTQRTRTPPATLSKATTGSFKFSKEQLQRHDNNNNNNNNQHHPGLHRTSSTLSNISMNSRRSTMSARPKKVPHQKKTPNSSATDFPVIAVSSENEEQKQTNNNNNKNTTLDDDDGFGIMLTIEGDSEADTNSESTTTFLNSNQNTKTRNSPVRVDDHEHEHENVLVKGNENRNSTNNIDGKDMSGSTADNNIVETLRKMNRELRDALETTRKERDEYQFQLNQALKELVGVDTKTLKDGSELKKNVGAALEALMHQVKLLSEKNRLLEEKMLEYNGSSKKKTITNDNVNAQTKPHHQQLNQINNLRSTSTATVQSVQSITSAVVPAAHHPNPKRSPMSVKSPNPKTVTGSGGGAQKGIVPHHQLPSPFARENEQQHHVRQSSVATTSSMVSNVNNVNNQNNNSEEEEECFMSPEPTRPY